MTKKFFFSKDDFIKFKGGELQNTRESKQAPRRCIKETPTNNKEARSKKERITTTSKVTKRNQMGGEDQTP